ncbi:MAG: PAS domain-containing sensor histidine kinase [Desulfuromonas sp.]|nr:MAG: PAS domain-containing sensor histidine kinase [Desulfuromonas sp.]
MTRTLEKRIVIFTLLSLTIVVIVNTAFNIESYRRDYRDSLLLRSHSQAKGLRNSIEKVLDLGIPLNEMSGIDERCSVIVNSDPEIGFCLIEDPSGVITFGSELAHKLVQDSVGLSLSDNNNVILDFPGIGEFYTIQQPLTAADGSIAGRIRIGFPASVVADKTDSMIRRSVVVLISAFFFASLLIILFVKRNVIKPVNQLKNVASDIAGGDFNVVVPQLVTRELAELGHSLEEMAASLRERDTEIRQSYLELENSNNQLRELYEKQETTGRELGRSREMYRSLLDNASDAIIVSDEESRIVMINKAAESFFSISRDRAEAMALSDFFALVDVLDGDNLSRQFRNVLHGEALETEIRFVRPSDSLKLVGWAKCSSIVEKRGKRVVQTIVRDVTHEWEVKENLKKSAGELERLNTMKDSFLGVASHELKTPLTVILGYTELLLGDMAPLVGEQALPMIGHINRSAERLSKIVRDMVDVTLLDKQNIRLRCQEVDLKKMIYSVADEVEYFINKRKQKLVLDLSDEAKCLWCDEERINQTLSNLVTNAIKFTPDEGTVTISTRMVEGSHSGTGDDNAPYVEIAIKDTGIGIADKDQLHIFDKFYEVGEIEGHFTAESAFRGKGTGLGLTIAKGFVDLHEGEIWVESAGHDPETCPGSTFYILLPQYERTLQNSDQKVN